MAVMVQFDHYKAIVILSEAVFQRSEEFGIPDSHLEAVSPKAGVFQPTEGSCVGYPGITTREIPHYA